MSSSPTYLAALLVTCLGTGCGRINIDPLSSTADGQPERSYVDVILADRPIAYFHLEEQTGTSALSTTGSEVGTYRSSGPSGIVDLARPGVLAGSLAPADNRAVRFRGEGNAGDGSEGYVEVSTTIVAWTGDFSIELWIQPAEPSPVGWGGHAFVCEDYLTNGFRLGWSADRTVRMWSTEGAGTMSVRASTQLAIGTWSHLVAVRQADVATLYLDGAVIASGPFQMIPPTASADCGFAAFHGLFTSAMFDELALYATALTPAQIAAHHDAAQR